MRKLVFWVGILSIPYAFLWFNMLHVFASTWSKKPKSFYSPLPPTQIKITPEQKNAKEEKVLAITLPSISFALPEVPLSSNISLLPRRQVFNLSCEFAVASAIIYHYTLDPKFNAWNEEVAERALIEKVGASPNPNVGIRMGEILKGDLTTLFINLNKRFGGTEYYGVHAPPFFDLFSQYGLLAKPIMREVNVIEELKQAISSGHLVMAWIRLGFGKPVDAALFYGNVPIIRGEHTVVLQGYDENGFDVMDPAIGLTRHISYTTLLEASEPFPLPFLEVSQSSDSARENIAMNEPLPRKETSLPREKVNVSVENGSGKIGKGTQIAAILGDFGYKVVSLKNAGNFQYEDVSIHIKESISDYKNLLQKDLEFAKYNVATVAADLLENNPSDAIVIIGN